MSSEHTQSVTVKRKTKKKSGYIVREEDGEYYVDEVPPKARVNVDDKIVAINGVKKEDFADEHEANELIESVQLVIVPQAELEEYDRKKAEEDGSDEDGGVGARAAGDNDEGGRAIKCPYCGAENVDLEPDEDGDLVCEECGEILDVVEENPEALVVRDEDEGAIVPAEEYEDEGGGGGDGGDDDAPHPSENFNPGDVITITVGKANPKQDAGIKIEQKENRKYYVRKVAPKGLFAATPVIVGDKLLELNGKDTHDYKNLNALKKTIRDEGRITIMVVRRDPDASDSSASSILDTDDDDDESEFDSDEGLEEMDGGPSDAVVVRQDDDYEEEDEEEEDDSEGFDGEYCGCVWCPACVPDNQ